MSEFDVAIVGLGPTGALLANLCGLYGLRTVVYETSAHPYPQPRACHLDGEIARTLAQCGFGDELHDLLTVSAGMEFVDPGGRRLFSFEEFEREPLLGWHEDYVFIQPELDTMLRRGLGRFDREAMDVRLGAAAPPIDQLVDVAQWVIGCDGASSGVRSALGIALEDLGYDQEWLVVDLLVDAAASAHLPAIIQQVCDENRLATFVPSHGRHRRWEFRLDPDVERPDPWTLLAPWGIDAGNSQLVRAVPYRFHALVAERWRGGPDARVLLAGDAAHQMPPFMGQGMCSGIRDAAALAWRLASPADAPTLLDDYETERRLHVEAVIDLSVQAGDLLDTLAADVSAGRPLRLPESAPHDPTRWSRLPGLDLGRGFPIGHQVPGPPGLDDALGLEWAWVAAEPSFAPDGPVSRVVCEPRATYGHAAVLVRPDRYIVAVSEA